MTARRPPKITPEQAAENLKKAQAWSRANQGSGVEVVGGKLGVWLRKGDQSKQIVASDVFTQKAGAALADFLSQSDSLLMDLWEGLEA